LVKKALVRSRPLLPFCEHPRTARHDQSQSCFIFKDDFLAGGEPAGPVVTLQTISRFLADPTRIDFSTYLSLRTTRISSEVLEHYDKKLLESKVFHKEMEEKILAASKASKAKKVDKYKALVTKLHGLMGSDLWAVLAIKSEFMDRRMTAFKKAPSKATNKVLRNIAEECKLTFKAAIDANYLELGFLSASDPFENSLRSYCTQRFPGTRLLTLASDEVLELVVAGEYPVSVAKACYSGLGDVFASAVHDELKIAKMVWRQCFTTSNGKLFQFRDEPFTMNRLKETFERANLSYAALSPIAQEFYSLSWMTEADRTRYLMDTSWNIGGGLRSYLAQAVNLKCLKDRNFDAMLQSASNSCDRDCY